MGTARTVTSAVVAWLVVVAVGSTVVWLVIARAGDGIAPTVGPELPAASPSPHPSSRGPSDHPSPPQTPATSTTTSPAAGAPQRRTWQVPGGLVTVECRGAAISLVASSADAGFTVDPGSLGPGEVDVTFEGQGEEGRETRVRAHCEGGVPVSEVDARDD